MKILGLIGGMSWESTLLYYQLINRRVRAKMGGLHSSKCLIYSFDFAEIAHLQHCGKWDEAGVLLGEAAANLKRGGAHAIVICTNTMHKLAFAVERNSGLPLLHIADPTADAIKQAGYQRVGLMGTRFTMEQDFYKNRLIEQHGLDVLIPDESDRGTINRVIYDELCIGLVKDESRHAVVAIIQRMQAAGAQCIILGCTEIGMLLANADLPLPAFDTTVIHAEAAADWAMQGIEFI